MLKCGKLSIKARFSGASIFIHPEPCLIKREGQEAATCECPLRLNISYPVKPS